ncbi:MAG: YfhO family protein [Flavobacteriaceae bacterium]
MRKLIRSTFLKNVIPHFIITLIFVIISLVFYYPLLSGKKLVQSDIIQYKGMSKQLNDYRSSNGEETYWIDNAFGGMPTYQLGAKYPADFLSPIYDLIRLIPRPAHILFLYFFSIYIFLTILKLPWKYSVFGSLGFGFSTYLLIILQVGHNTKALAISFIPLVLSGVIMIFRKNFLYGFILTSISLAMQIRANHYQMTYYLMFLIGLLILFYFYQFIKKKEFKKLYIPLIILFCSTVISLGFNSTPIITTYEYSKFSTRSGSELKYNFDGSERIKTNGLEYDYITEYSYGIFESIGLIAPRVQGGSSREDLGNDSEIYSFLINKGVSIEQADSFIKNVPTYWGNQPILEAPAYIGISIFFFAIIAVFYSNNRLKYWLISGVLISLFLSWGKNFSILTDIFINYFPFYNKFRAVSSIQVILEFCFPVLASIGLATIVDKKKEFWKSILKTSLIISGVLLLIILSKNLISFSGLMDPYLKSAYGDLLFEKILDERKSIFVYDLVRAIIFLLTLALISILFKMDKITLNKMMFSVIAILLIDLIGISNRYIDRSQFVSKINHETPFNISNADLAIKKDTTRYRVFEPRFGLTGARTSFFHNSIGGYHAAKPRRFEELYKLYQERGVESFLNMINVKYIINSDDNGLKPYKNPDHYGNAWFVNQLKEVSTPDSVITFMQKKDLKNTAVIIKDSYNEKIPFKFINDSLANIKLIKSTPNYLEYSFNSKEDQLIVFSEIFYPNGWTLKVDNKFKEILNINYILRGAYVKAGIHKLVFEFKPKLVKVGTNIRWLTLIVFISFLIGLLKFESSLNQRTK